jgi:hypothetical protein
MTILCRIARAPMLALSMVLCVAVIDAMAQSTTAAPLQQSELERQKLERQKLELEILNLKAQRFSALTFGSLTVLVALAGVVSTMWAASRTRGATLDQSVHEQRLTVYPGLVNAAAPLAIYFPEQESGSRTIGPSDCANIGRAISKWYFSGGGLLLSENSRSAYFALMSALTRASLAREISAPLFPDDAEAISLEKMNDYRAELSARHNLDDVDGWSFGTAGAGTATPGERFKDFVFLQRLSSALRTALATDLRSRRTTS